MKCVVCHEIDDLTSEIAHCFPFKQLIYRYWDARPVMFCVQSVPEIDLMLAILAIFHGCRFGFYIIMMFVTVVMYV